MSSTESQIEDTNDAVESTGGVLLRQYRILCWITCLACLFFVGLSYRLSQRLKQTQTTAQTQSNQLALTDPLTLSKVRDQNFEFVIRNYGVEYTGRTGDYIDGAILLYGAWEKDVLFFLRDYLNSCGNEKPVFLDVGCNAGQLSLFLSQWVGQIHAFDPYPPVVERFQQMIAANGFTNISVHQIGLGDKNETIPFFKPPDYNTGMGSFRDTDGEQHRETAGEFQVVRGDDWLAQNEVSGIEVIKIDVEGFEEFVLRGLADTIRAQRPLIVFEVSSPPGGTIESLGQLQGLFPESYRLLVFRPHATTLYDGRYELGDFNRPDHLFFQTPHTNTRQAMLVAVPEEKDVPLSPSGLSSEIVEGASSEESTSG